MAWGGGRPGGGRPRKDDLYYSAIREAEQKVADKLPHIAARMLELADGILVQEEDEKTGQTHIYQRAPDRMAIEYLWNRIAGKPREHVELDAEVNTSGGDSSEYLTDEQRAAVRAAIFRQPGTGGS